MPQAPGCTSCRRAWGKDPAMLRSLLKGELGPQMGCGGLQAVQGCEAAGLGVRQGWQEVGMGPVGKSGACRLSLLLPGELSQAPGGKGQHRELGWPSWGCTGDVGPEPRVCPLWMKERQALQLPEGLWAQSVH